MMMMTTTPWDEKTKTQRKTCPSLLRLAFQSWTPSLGREWKCNPSESKYECGGGADADVDGSDRIELVCLFIPPLQEILYTPWFFHSLPPATKCTHLMVDFPQYCPKVGMVRNVSVLNIPVLTNYYKYIKIDTQNGSTLA